MRDVDSKAAVLLVVVAVGVLAAGLTGCGSATPTAPPAVLIFEADEAAGAGEGATRARVASSAIYPRGPVVFRGTRFDERTPDATGERIELRRSGDGADGVFTDTLFVLDDDDERLVRTNRFRRDAHGAVVLLATTNHEQRSTAMYEPPLVGAEAGGVGRDGVETASAVSIDDKSAGEATMRVVYVGDEMVEVGGVQVRAARLETTFVLKPRPAVRVERSFVRWIAAVDAGPARTVRERTHEVIRAGPITVSERRFVDVWE